MSNHPLARPAAYRRRSGRYGPPLIFGLLVAIIAALIRGTQHLGPKILNSLPFGDLGRAIMVGLCVLAIGITVDEIITRWAHSRKEILGIV